MEGNENLKKVGSILAKSLLSKLSLGAVVALLIIFLSIIIIISAVLGSELDDNSGWTGGNSQLPDDVLLWEDDIREAMEKHDLDEKYLYVLLAIMKQESNGDVIASNGDIFQASESKCGSIGCITDPLESIDQAVIHFKNNVEYAKGNMEVAIASYNFGNGFATWTQENHDNEWSVEIAIEYSQYMMTKVSNPENYTCIRKEAKEHGACYGDILYVNSILDFVPSEDEGNKEKVDFEGELVMPISPVRVTSNFGTRILNGEVTEHKGIDLGCVEAITPITSAGSGEVVYSEFNTGGYGNTVIIKHKDGFYTHYAHMFSNDVTKGDYVKKGEQVGFCGNTGDSYGAHLHFETKSEEWAGHKDPRNYLDFPSKQ